MVFLDDNIGVVDVVGIVLADHVRAQKLLHLKGERLT
jgi:hypothetical protein